MSHFLTNLHFTFASLIHDQLFAGLRTPQIPLTGRTYLLTGAASPLVVAAAVHLARLKPARIVLGHPASALASASATEAETHERLASRIRREAGDGFTGELDVWALDMADYDSVLRFAERARATLLRLDGVILGEDCWYDVAREWRTTQHGWERMLQINVVSTALLDPFYVAFRADNAPRILDALNESSTHIDRYGMTKLVLLMLARQMGQLPIAHKVVINCANPGIVRTQKSRLCVSCTNLLAWSPEDGATNLVYAVLKPTPPGAYLAACQIRDPPMWVSSLDGQQAQQRVWWELLDVWMRITPEALGVVGFGLKGVQS
ncbi:unnamed protein product [Mycena citricolor]|uniref:Uncharacterized protein n=1 Tax=Mycena citricolor TaxID=2018698 RepID=A0AAD2HCQ3_9AGAR|nr:unnamed protein product [Mycena citricolor]